MSATSHHLPGDVGTPDDAAAPSPWRRLRRAWPIVAIAVAGLAAWHFDLHHRLNLDAFIANRAVVVDFVAAHYVAALATLFVVYVVVVALSVPCGLALTMASGFLFGPVVGGLASALAATLGATAIFLAARSSLGEGLRARAGPRLEKIACGFCRDAFNYVLFLRLVPIAPFWLVNLAPAILGVPTRAYVLATAIGILPATFVFAALGSGLDSVVAAQEAANAACLAAGTCTVSLHPKALVTPDLVAALAALGVLSLVPVVFRRWRARRGRCG